MEGGGDKEWKMSEMDVRRRRSVDGVGGGR